MARLLVLCALVYAWLSHVRARLLLSPEVEAIFSRATAFPSWARVNESEAGNETPRDFRFLNNVTSEYWVDGTTVPDVPFDIGESYAGQMLLSDDINEQNKMFFWFFPMASENPREERDIIIWLNGGPGCSSMTGLLQEHGPFLWPPGTFRPVRNPWSWHRLAHIIYIDQPIGTGYSTGPRTYADEDDVARDFIRFWRRFVDTFQLHGARVFVTGESYAGQYVPYIAMHMLDLRDSGETAYFDVRGALLYDPLFGNKKVQSDVPSVHFIERTSLLHPFDPIFMANIKREAYECGFSEYLARYLTYPPPREPQPHNAPGTGVPRCQYLRENIMMEALELNPCWDIYNVAALCPPKWSVVGPMGLYGYITDGGETYFDRPDVKRATNVNMTEPWRQCSAGVFAGKDSSLPSAVYALPSVIDRTSNVFIAHGRLDFVLIDEGTLLTIQNMTWGGLRGFQQPPTEPLIVPHYSMATMLGPVAGNRTQMEHVDLSGAAGFGQFGVAHQERGLTYVGVELSGHMGPQMAPAAGMRMVEVMLGKTANLSSYERFVLDKDQSDASGRG